MKKWRLLILPALCLIPIAVLAQSTGDIAITGRVTNGTPGGTLPAGEPVTLQFYQEGLWTNIYTTTLSADGTFRFDDFTAETGSSFVTHLRYQDVHYYSEPATLEGDADLTADIMIYEPMDDPSTIVIEQAHLFIVPMGDRVRIAEYYLIGNSSDRTFAGVEDENGAFRTVTFSLPEGASNLSFDGPGLGERFVGDETVFADTRPIPPGTTTVDVDFSYELPFSEGMALQRALDVPISLVAIIVNGETVGIEGDGIVAGGMMDTQMGTAASYSAGPLAAGETLAFTFVPQTQKMTTSPATTGPTGPRVRNTTQETGIGIVALALGGLAGYLIWQAKPATPPMPEYASPLVEDIVALDDSFVAGEIEEEPYQQQRATLKRRLRAQMQRHKR